MSQPVGEKHGVCPVAHGLLRVTFHEPQFFQLVGHQAGHTEVYVPPLDAGSRDVQHMVVASFHDAVNLPLAGGEFPADRRGARVVGAIVLVCLGACVAEHQPSGFQRMRRGGAMHDFPMHRQDGGEAGHAAFGGGDAAEYACDGLFRDTRAAQAHGHGVHFIPDGAGFLDFFDFGRAFHHALVDDSHNQFQRSFFTLL